MRYFFIDKHIEKEIKDFVIVLKKNNIYFEKMILFGSYAKGKARKYSDIDLAVISSQFGKDERKELMLLSKLSWRISDRIEAIPISPKFMQSKYHPLIGEIKKYGKTVYVS